MNKELAFIATGVEEAISPARVIARPGTFDFMEARKKYSKRIAVRAQADALLDGRPTRIYQNGELYTVGHVLTAVSVHPLFSGAAMAAYAGNVHPMKDLIRRVAQYAICEHLCPGEADELGFLK